VTSGRLIGQTPPLHS